MKTYGQIFKETVEDDLRTQNVTSIPPEERAAKEYAKQWVSRAATEAGDDTRSVTANANVIWRFKQEIDEQ